MIDDHRLRLFGDHEFGIGRTCPLTERALDVLRRAGNPFRNYFARNPDDEEWQGSATTRPRKLYALHSREQLLGVVDLYRHAP